MRTIDDDQRRARLGLRHRLARNAKATDVEATVASLVGLHSSDPVSPYLSARARTDGFEPSDLETALYDSRSLLRILGMRRTMFVVPRELGGIVDSACTKALAPAQRKRLTDLIAQQGVAADPGKWLGDVEAATLAAIADAGEATAVELTRAVPELGTKFTFGEGRKWGGTIGLSTRVLFLLACEGRIVRGRPLGSWVSSQYRWSITEQWLGTSLVLPPRRQARAALVERWLAGFGPGTLDDLKWWTGWNLGDTRTALADAGAVDVALESGTGYVLEDDVEGAAEPEPWAALLPGLDPTVMGWKQRDWYLGDLAPQLFDRNGNASPTVWLDGRVVGAWAQHPDGEIVFGLLGDVGRQGRALIEAEAEELGRWLGDARPVPRFRTPLEKSLLC